MYNYPKCGKGILERSFKPAKIAVRRDSSYQRLLEKCKSAVFPEGAGTSDQVYVADASGVCICSNPFLTIDTSSGEEKTIPWTLQTYIQLAGSKYPSKTRLYCVGPKMDGRYHCIISPKKHGFCTYLYIYMWDNVLRILEL